MSIFLTLRRLGEDPHVEPLVDQLPPPLILSVTLIIILSTLPRSLFLSFLHLLPVHQRKT